MRRGRYASCVHVVGLFLFLNSIGCLWTNYKSYRNKAYDNQYGLYLELWSFHLMFCHILGFRLKSSPCFQCTLYNQIHYRNIRHYKLHNNRNRLYFVKLKWNYFIALAFHYQIWSLKNQIKLTAFGVFSIWFHYLGDTFSITVRCVTLMRFDRIIRTQNTTVCGRTIVPSIAFWELKIVMLQENLMIKRLQDSHKQGNCMVFV